MKRLVLLIIVLISLNVFSKDDFSESYVKFRNEQKKIFGSFRDECNRKYVEFLLTAWDWYEGKAPMPLPEEKNPVPPQPYDDKVDTEPVTIQPVQVQPIEDSPQPMPVEPIREDLSGDEDSFSVSFFGVSCAVRLPRLADIGLNDCKPVTIADGWERLSNARMNNSIRDCLEARIRYNMCDWAYLMFLDELSGRYCSDSNMATLLMAFLYSQSGYQMRLAVDEGKLVMLYGSRHQIFDKRYFIVDNMCFYPWGESSGSISICNASFEGETPMSLLINKEQVSGELMSEERRIVSARYADMCALSRVPQNLIEFYERYPTSAYDGNPMTRWAMYANAPLAQKTKDLIYPALRASVEDKSESDAANRLLNWVQTGFVYEYDDKVWGHDRAFFAEESLYYPYCDCEDRSILFSRLVRDLLGLDVALIYYPGHLATAVCFTGKEKGDAIIIRDRRYVICDPTYIGAPVGTQMPGLEYDNVQAIVLDR